ncbi:hypothetical protein HY468_00555 [Candidatus Roizmanbacteria bacterium]|nr:hypothetical protein [Candidatus Roizmanbacteria bacterium]
MKRHHLRSSSAQFPTPILPTLRDNRQVIQKNLVLPEPWTNITIDYNSITDTFQDVRYIGELRERWKEIKKIHNIPANGRL